MLDLVYTNKGYLSLLGLHTDLQAIVRWTFAHNEGYVLGCNSYPDRRADRKLAFFGNVFRKAASELDSPQTLKDALLKDADFVASLSTLVSLLSLHVMHNADVSLV